MNQTFRAISHAGYCEQNLTLKQMSNNNRRLTGESEQKHESYEK
jgi:hypothetical protein